MVHIFYFFRDVMYMIEGYVRWLIDLITDKTSKRALYRLSICKHCEYHKKGICTLCGCILKAKTRVDFIEDELGISIDGCPKRKW